MINNDQQLIIKIIFSLKGYFEIIKKFSNLLSPKDKNFGLKKLKMLSKDNKYYSKISMRLKKLTKLILILNAQLSF